MEVKDLEEYAAFYLKRLPEDDAYHSLIEAGPHIIPILAKAIVSQKDGRIRAQILQVIWEQRHPSAIPILADALRDPSPHVWKQALDGLVTLDRPECVAVIEAAQDRRFESEQDAVQFRDWMKEAINQLRHGDFGERLTKQTPSE